MSTLALNVGSSTLKFGLFCHESVELVAGSVVWPRDKGRATAALRFPCEWSEQLLEGVQTPADAVPWLLEHLPQVVPLKTCWPVRAVGHRIVHGGTQYAEPVVIDDRVRAAVARLADLAPMHNPPALACVKAVTCALPDVPQVAVFDTALYAKLPPRAFLYPVPYEWYAAWGVRRYGFHGISHGYCLRRVGELCKRDPRDLRVVTCHLGSGCSATAFRDGRAVATTMGFTPLDGLMMATRPGAIDPGVLLHLLRSGRATAGELTEAVERRSGLLGVSGLSGDYRAVEAAAFGGHQRAKVALEMFADRVRSAVGGLAVTLGGVDALVFTGGIGERSATLRTAVCEGLECLGVRLDHARNLACRSDLDVATALSPARILVVAAREEPEVARAAARLLNADGRATTR